MILKQVVLPVIKVSIPVAFMKAAMQIKNNTKTEQTQQKYKR